MEEDKIIKPHGMTSEKASRVKARGHKKEFIYATLIKGEIVKGTKKGDVRDINGKIHSLKGGSEIQRKSGRHGKWQIFLYKKSRFEEDTTFCGREIFLEILNQFPLTYKEYELNKEQVKENVKNYMVKLKEFLTDRQNRFDFFNKSFFDERVDYLVIYDDEVFYVFDKDEVIETFVDFLKVENNSSLQKVVFHYKRIISEIEYRTTDDGKYPAILFNMQKRQAFDLLTEKIIEHKSFNPVIKVYGKAIEYFENYPL
jgi:hypothetical protein